MATTGDIPRQGDTGTPVFRRTLAHYPNRNSGEQS